MLKLAVKSGLPLVAVQTTDPINIEQVLKFVLGEKVTQLQFTVLGNKVSISPDKNIAPSKVYWMLYREVDWTKMYEVLVQKGSTLVVVNPKELHESMYDAGLLSCPPGMIKKFVDKYFEGSDKDKAKMIGAFSGLSYKEVVEITKMATVQHGNFTPRAVQDIRRKYFPSIAGLQQLSTEITYYYPSQEVQQWLDEDAPFIGNAPLKSLEPRGLLFSGPPGTGKTLGAKYIANQLNLPLYLLDLGMILNKWVGESEKGLKTALQQAESCAPCIMLIDEVEKLFQSDAESGVSVRLLASLLWWLSEHSSGVFTIMTTNNASKIPPELHRKGRIDKEIEFSGVHQSNVGDFVDQLLGSFSNVVDVDAGLISSIVGDAQKEMNNTCEAIAQSDLTDLVLRRVKKIYLDKLKTSS